ncbi:hypothetical protein GIB67_013474 [Kingdonia uniflora]|uniref:NPH3 domain-containing protein n=1 Tax=Kingdonia uniflora TaxID=39325 RepID=A0A7J7LR48_9MAGN|nr:hypothetical protein GIB67_013474 [Kingdonia uniflora]
MSLYIYQEKKTGTIMKFMKLGTKADTFYNTDEATRSVSSDVPMDLLIQINNTKYLLHKFPLLPKCGLLQQRLCAVSSDHSSRVSLQLHDIPGGEEAFELCVKFCYGIRISLSCHNFVPAFCAAKFLRMTETMEKGNLVLKLEAFFTSCILEGWRDSIITLQTTTEVPDWSENIGINHRCINSIVGKILTHPSKVRWSYTYTRPGYAEKQHRSIPKDWWTEDISDLEIDTFRCVIITIRSATTFPSQLIGEALHVYACKWLPNMRGAPECSESQSEEGQGKKIRILESIVSLIPADMDSVTIQFLLKLISITNFLGGSRSIMVELIKKCGHKLQEATVNDLHHMHNIELVKTLMESFLVELHKERSRDELESLGSLRKVGKLLDSYLQIIAKDVNLPIAKMVSLAESLPDNARPEHDGIYKAINIYLKVHPELSKTERKQLCQILDCRRLSPEICSHAIRNDRLPLRTIVQALFFDRARPPMSNKLTLTEQQHTRNVDHENLSHGKTSEIKIAKGKVVREDGASGSKTPRKN